MNIPAALEIGTKVWSDDKAQSLGTWLRTFARSAVKPRTESRIRSSEASSGVAPGYRLGDSVRHGRFGTGRVIAPWPDGTLLVRFDGEAKSRLIWPSLLG